MGRIRTFKAKVLLLVLVVLLTAALSFVVLSKREIESALYHREQEASKNVLYLVLQTIENQYQDFIDHNRTVLEMRKDAMKALSRVAISTIDGFYERFKKGLLSEYEAKQQGATIIFSFLMRATRPSPIRILSLWVENSGTTETPKVCWSSRS